ncbi:MAG TPA: hypothetical protein VHV10_10830 [Ktedonobacteraceae bacterium]|jgi:hypothetical protein|nr:hypothetical protein [Ktedonobacteraceae bacterium]
MPQPLRIEQISPPELTPDETDLFRHAMAEGIHQALLDHPAFFTLGDILFSLAMQDCQEVSERRILIWTGGWNGGYRGMIINNQNDPSGVTILAKDVKTKPRMKSLLYRLEMVDAVLAQF